MVFGVVCREPIIDWGGSQRFGRCMGMPGGMSERVDIWNIMRGISVRIVVEEVLRWIGVGVGWEGWKGDDATSAWRVHGAGVGKRGRAVVVGGSRWHGGGFGAVEDVVVENTWGILVKVTVAGG